MDTSDKIVQDQFASLPLEVREAISRVPWESRVADIAKREGLNTEKSQALQTETMLVLYGFLSFEHYAENIQSNVGTDEEQAERIQKLISDEIISDIEKQLEMIEAVAPKDIAPTASGPAPEPEKKSILDIPPEIMARQIKMPEEPVAAKPAVPEVAPANLPMVEPGETVHEVPHVEATQPSPTPSPARAPTPAPQTPKPKSVIEEKLSQVVIATNGPRSYDNGKDPYREPLE